jgi:hypothetical protein
MMKDGHFLCMAQSGVSIVYQAVVTSYSRLNGINQHYGSCKLGYSLLEVFG